MILAIDNYSLGMDDDAVIVAVSEPAMDGKANKELHKFLCKTFSVRLKDMELVRGGKSRTKVFCIEKYDLNAAFKILQAVLDDKE